MPLENYGAAATGMAGLAAAPANAFFNSYNDAQQNQRQNALVAEGQRRTALVEQNQLTEQQAAQHKQELMQGVAKLEWMLKEPDLGALLNSDPKKAQGLSQMLGVDLLAVDEPTRRQALERLHGHLASQLGKGPPELRQDTDTGPKLGNYNPGDYTPESFAQFVTSKDPSRLQRYVTPAQDKVVIVNGVPTMVDPRTAQQTPLTTADAQNTAAEAAAAAAARGRTTGASQATAAAQLPTAQGNATEMRRVINDLKSAPGLRFIVGGYSVAPVVPGTDQADAFAKYEQLQGKLFLEAFNTLKGGGQITEVEGAKATAAISSLANRRQSLHSYNKAIADLESVVNAAEKRASFKAGKSVPGSQNDPLGIR
jgi:hypothetical protein